MGRIQNPNWHSIHRLGCRLWFALELLPEETTILSWIKLRGEADLSYSNQLESSMGLYLEAHTSFVSQSLAPVASYSMKNTKNKLKASQVQAGSNRLRVDNAKFVDRRKEKCGFIEKIDRNAPPGKTSVQIEMDEALVIQTLLFVAGVNTLLQTLFGTRLPAIVGGSNTYIMFIIKDYSNPQCFDLPHEINYEVAEMVMSRILRMKSEVEQNDANSTEVGAEEKEASLIFKSIMDDVLENKICDLYDLYVERLEEGSGPPVARLYEEIALLWPSGAMSTDGIENVVNQRKDRRLYSHQKERKKMLAPEAEDATKNNQENLRKYKMKGSSSSCRYEE